MRLVIITCFLFITFSYGISQNVNPPLGYVFDDTEVPRIDIYINSTDLQLIFDDVESDTEYPATFIFTKSTGIDTIENIGFRLRGNTSRRAQKKSFKVSFNSFEPGRKFHGLEKLNLNGEHNDPSIIRSKLCWDLYNEINIPSSRANHIELYINQQYRGLYVNIEHIDEEFIKSRFEDNSGNLYKCLWPADLNYKGSNPSLYKETFNDRRVYDLKTNKEIDDYSNLANFIDVLNNSSLPLDQECLFGELFNVDDYLKVMAMDILLSNWDGPLVNKNNFYLYHEPSTGKFHYIPFDLDNTLGISWASTDWTNADIYNWSDFFGNNIPLYNKVLVGNYRDQFSYYMNKILADQFNIVNLFNYLNEKRDLIKSFRENDDYASRDYGWSFNDFFESYDNALGAHVKEGLVQYISKRESSALSQLQINNIAPVVHVIEHWTDTNLSFDISVTNETPISDITFIYSIDGGPQVQEVLSLDSNGEAVFSFDYNMIGEFTYSISALDSEGLLNTTADCGRLLPLGFPEGPDLVINEFMASNDTTVSDEVGEYDDWIEIYNNDIQPVQLSGRYLTDDLDNPSKWELPFINLSPGSYVIIWADGDTEQGDNHASFKLNKEKESVGIFDSADNNYAPLDTIRYSNQEEDKSYARIPNGIGAFQLTENVTFGSNNDMITSTSTLQENIPFIFPNPTSGIININFGSLGYTIEVYNLLGHRLKVYVNQESIDLSELNSGKYWLNVSGADQSFWKPIILIK